MVGEIHKLAGRHQAHRYLTSLADLWADYSYETEKEGEYAKENKWNQTADDGLSCIAAEVNCLFYIGRIGEESYWSH